MTGRPTPLLNAAAGAGGIIVAGIAVVDAGIDLCVALGLRPDVADPLNAFVVAVVVFAGAIYGVRKFGEPEVTPLSDPRDHEGRPLVPAGELDVASSPPAEPAVTVSVAAPDDDSVRPPDLEPELVGASR